MAPGWGFTLPFRLATHVIHAMVQCRTVKAHDCLVICLLTVTLLILYALLCLLYILFANRTSIVYMYCTVVHILTA